MIQSLLELVYPRYCFGCDRRLILQEQFLCLGCELKLPFTNHHKLLENEVFLMFRPHNPIQFGGSLLFFKKGSTVQSILHEIKYRDNRELAYNLSQKMALVLEGVNKELEQPWDVVLPVPIHRRKRRKRGYNQSELLAKAICKNLNIRLDNQSIISKRKRTSQTGKGRFDRWLNVNENFELKKMDQLRGKHVLLLDDVITTGSTILSCIDQLSKIEGVRISVFSLAFADRL